MTEQSGNPAVEHQAHRWPETIIVPLDESAMAESTLPLASRLAQATNAGVEIVSAPSIMGLAMAMQAGDPTGTWSSKAAVPPEELLARDRKALSDYLDIAAGGLARQGLRASCRIIDDVPAGAICRAAEEADAPLITMTTHGRGGIRRWALGSVADQVLHRAEAPLLLLRDSARGAGEIEHVLVALDGSELAEEILPFALPLAESLGAKVTLARAVERDEDAMRRLNGAVAGSDALRSEWATDYLQEQAAEIREGYPNLEIQTEVLYGQHAADALVDRAEEGGFDLIAMTTHGHGGLRRVALGSVTDRVARAAESPVLIVRTGLSEHSEREREAIQTQS